MAKTLFRPNNDKAFDPKPVCFKVRQGTRDRILEIPDLQNKLRTFVESELQKTTQKE